MICTEAFVILSRALCKKADSGYYWTMQCLKKKGITLKELASKPKAAVKAGRSVNAVKSHFSLKSFTITEELHHL